MLDFKLAILEQSTSSAPFTTEDFLRKLFPNFWSFLINFIALFVLIAAVYFLAHKPIKKFVERRREYVASNLRESEEAKEKYEAMVRDSDHLVSDAKKKADEIIKQAQFYATVEAARITDSARDEASRRLLSADEEIKQAKEEARESIRQEIVNVALDASKQVLGREVSQADNARLVAEFVSDVEKRGNE